MQIFRENKNYRFSLRQIDTVNFTEKFWSLIKEGFFIKTSFTEKLTFRQLVVKSTIVGNTD